VDPIQAQARENIAAVESAASGIEESTQAAAASGRYMDEIVGIVDVTASQVESIATASEEQSATSEEINRAVEEVNRIANETAEGMEVATTALSALTELSSELDEVIRQMTGDAPSARRVVATVARPAPSQRKALPPTRAAAPRHLAASRPTAAKALPASRPTPAKSPVRPVSGNGSIIQWDQSFSVGVKEIDNQHKKLVQMICDLHDAMRSGKGKTQMESILKELENYTVEHFGYEENLLEQNKYPGFLNHHKEHEKFVDKVVAFGNDFRENRAALTTEIMDFLKNWLVGHIKGIDKKYGPFLNERGIR
jgi:hemerythrin